MESSGQIVEKYLIEQADLTNTPIIGTFELLPICNMDCKMCYVRLNKNEVSKRGGLRTAKEWLDIAQQAKEAGLLFLQLTGGEILLYDEIEYLYAELSKMGFIISINTNGTLINEDNIKWLSKYPPRCVYITLYGGSNETYYELCNNPKGFDQTIKGINMLLENNITVKINSCITPYNVHDMEKIYKFAQEKGLEHELVAYSYPPMRRNEDLIGKNNRFSPQDCAKYTVEIRQNGLTEEEIRDNAIDFLTYIDNHDNKEDEHKMKCRAGHSMFWITWDGNMTPCGMMSRPFINVFENGVYDSWEYIKEETKKIRLCKQCIKCENQEVCNVCGASVLTETGGFNEVPEYVCKTTRKLVEIIKSKV